MVECNRVYVEKDVCYLFFMKDQFGSPLINTRKTKEIGYTNRGESVNVDYDENGNIIGIELVGSPSAIKPCQEE